MEIISYLAASDSSTPALGFIGWIVIGGLAGWIASKIMGTDAQMGVLANIGVGIVGGFLGGFLIGLLGFSSGNIIWSFLTCLLGAVVFLWIFKLIAGRK